MTDETKYAYDRLELDTSNRFFDADGRLHVKKSNISKATVNPYYGREIPNHIELGLDPNKIYMLLRHPDELEKAAKTFNNIPLLIKHIAVNAEKPEKESIAGTVGSDADFTNPYLTNSLCVWDQEAIDGIESEEKKELSCAYRYRAEMTAGTYEGVHHDGIMRDLMGNHVALVVNGRAGSDVVVADENPFSQKKEICMKKEQVKARVKAAMAKTKLAQDENIEEIIDAIVESVNEGEAVEPKPAQDNDVIEFLKDKISEDDLSTFKSMLSSANDTDPVKPVRKPTADNDPNNAKAQAKDNDPVKAKDTDPEAEPVTQAAMDSAIQKAVKNTEQRMRDLAQAQEDVAPIVGKVAMDSAESVYKFALDHLKVDTSGVHPSAFRSMIQMAKQHANKPAAKPIYAADASSSMLDLLPNLKKHLTGGN